MKMLKTLILFLASCLFSLMGYAGSFNETDGVAIKGHDPVAYFTEQKALPGTAEFKAEHQGSTFHFSSAANRDAFLANPGKYAPQYGGYCAFGVSRGYKADTDPKAFTVIDGKLYLNYSGEVKDMWSKDIPGYRIKADKNWTDVEKTTKVIR
jgi:YHS domain-containing protein